MDSLIETSVAARVRAHAQERPGKTALVVEDREVSYGSLWRASVDAARRISACGAGAGARVVLQASHTLAYVAAYLGTTLLGAVAVPYEHDLPDSAVAELAERVGAVCVMADHEVEGVPATLAMEASFDAEPACVQEGDPAPAAAAGDLAELLLTTGTTGRSKVVALSHRAVMSVVTNIICATGIEEDNVSLVPMPLNHVFALRRLQTGLTMGATVVLINGVVSLKKVFGALKAHGVTSLALVPSALAFIERTTKDFLGKFAGQIRYVESSSAPLPSATRAWLRGVLPQSRLYNSYGCTESTACCMVEYSHRADDVACVGSPCATAEIKILDPASGEPLESGYGRVAIGGTGVMEGYWGDEEATAATLADGMVLTNDLGCLREGELYVQGRLDDVAIIGGNNVSPVEVEDEINRFDGISECACVKASDPISGDRLVLFVVWDGGDEDVRGARLTAYMRDHLEAYKIPSEVHGLAAIPRTYNGKIDRKELARLIDGCSPARDSEGSAKQVHEEER